MKAPDQIVLVALNENRYEDAEWMENSPADTHNTEYIRKNAILEWLESMVYQHNEDRFDDGFNTAIGQVIDKINSL